MKLKTEHLILGAGALAVAYAIMQKQSPAVGAKKPTIYDIKRLTAETQPYYFSPNTLKAFGQTMKSFKIKPTYDGRYEIKAKAYDRSGRFMGYTVRYFNPITNDLDHE